MFPIISLTDGFYLPTYVVIISLTYSALLIWQVRRAALLDRDRNFTLDISMAIMLGGFLGARVLHIVFEAPEYYLENWSRVFEIWRGGFVFYGGALGAAAAVFGLFAGDARLGQK